MRRRIEIFDVWDLLISFGGREHVFQFMFPPSLEDFLLVCKMLPWTGVWDETLIPFLRNDVTVSNWPVVEEGKKAGSRSFSGPLGFVRVGISRSRVWENEA